MRSTTGAGVKLLSVDAFRRLVGIVQMQQRTVIVLRDAGESQLFRETLHLRLRVRPEPGRA